MILCKVGDRYYWVTPDSIVSVRYALVAVDYFTKWTEAEAISIINQDHVMKFIWRNLICRFELPHAIISDSEK